MIENCCNKYISPLERRQECSSKNVINFHMDDDAEQIRALADALRALERALAGSSIARELGAISGAIGQMEGVASTPANELRILHGALTDFAMLSGVALGILGVRDALVLLGGPKVWIAAGALGAISIALNAFPRLFEDAASSAEDFAESLAGLTHLEKLQHLQELTKRLEELDQAWAAALDPDISTIELLEGMVGLEGGARDLHREITALEEMVGIFDQGQLDAAINTAKMEEAIGDAAGAISNLKTAYQEAFDAAYASINAQLGLFDRMNFEASKAKLSGKIKNARVSLQRFASDFFLSLTTPATVFSSSQTHFP
jgi:hypothetical protein